MNVEYTQSSGNIYEDLGFRDAHERLAKAKLAMRINEIIEKRGLKQIDAAKLLRINQPKISALARGRLRGFSIERLIYFLNLLNQDVDIIIKDTSESVLFGHLEVAVENSINAAKVKQAVENILDARKDHTLGDDLTIEMLKNEGRRY